MDAGRKPVPDIFNGGRILEIPFFQRSYVWGEGQWERFLEDMGFVSENKKPYFFGSLILKQQATGADSEVGDVRTLIDGQQRLTTLVIFFKVLFLMENKNEYFEARFKLQLGNEELALRHNYSNSESFKRIAGLDKLEDIGEAECETDKILSVYNFFKKEIKKEKLNYKTIMNNLMFVSIELLPDEDEQQVFDTINSLGVRLTTAELLKNYFFDKSDIDFYNKSWKDIFEKDEDTISYWDTVVSTSRMRRTFVDLFFYSYLQIKVHEPRLNVHAKDKEYYSRVDGLFDSYKKFIKNHQLDKRVIIKEIKEYAGIFRKNFDYDVVDKGLTHESGIERINAIILGLEISTLIPYALFILKNVEDEKQKNELFGSIETYIMRRMVVRANTRNYGQLFSERLISRKILSKKQFKEFVEKSDDQINSFPDDSSLRDGFLNEKLINKQSKGILYMIESKIRNQSKHATLLMGLNKYSLEHLMPKNWKRKWKGATSQDEKDNRNKKLLTMGNLSIITQALNTSIRDSNWETKKSGSGEKPGLTVYSAGIEILSDFLKEPVWDESKIDERAEYLFKKSKSIWPSKM